MSALVPEGMIANFLEPIWLKLCYVINTVQSIPKKK